MMASAYLIFWAILILTCGYALVKGRKYERLAAGLFVAATILSVVDHALLQVRYQRLDVGEFMVDSTLLVSVIAIALASDRFWPLWVAGLQLVDSMAHVLKAITGDASSLGLWICRALLELPDSLHSVHRHVAAASADRVTRPSAGSLNDVGLSHPEG